ncbi:unnamed protein product [Polarella glacialis]|uniref:Uncharacterized protein n=1 Tax=Polarella glacialis TaxID=89957 RepID=A0A813LAH5_POLGL|nr:unnamed protein product [Polarella glacialis]
MYDVKACRTNHTCNTCKITTRINQWQHYTSVPKIDKNKSIAFVVCLLFQVLCATANNQRNTVDFLGTEKINALQCCYCCFVLLLLLLLLFLLLFSKNKVSNNMQQLVQR